MKIPEPLFAIINPAVRLLLKSPIHGFWSGSLMLITFTGRKSQRLFTTPVRYTEEGDMVRCYTSSENRWWRNMVGGADVVLRVKGRDKRYHATVIKGDPDRIREALEYYLGLYPQDAAYHDIRRNKNGGLVPEDLNRASRHAVVIEAKPA